MFETALFYVFAAVLLVSAVAIITARNPVHAVLCMVLCFFTTAGLWLLLQAEFLAIVLVLVYVGAVMVLFLFVVMMLDINLVRLREGFGEYLPIGGLVAVLLVAEMVIILSSDHFGLRQMPDPGALPANYSNTRELGRLLYTVYAYPFEIAAAILLTAIVAAITLTLRRRKDSKYQDPGRQINIEPRERVRIVKMRAEKKI